MIIFGILVLACGASALYSPSDDVVTLSPATFEQRVLKSDEVWIVEFFAPWCGHCKALTPEYKKAATALKGVVKLGAVDADEHKSLGGQYGVRGFPTIKIFGIDKNKPEDFNGQRTAQGIVDAALKAAKEKVNFQLSGKKSGGSSGGSGSGDDAVIELTDSNFDKLVKKSDEMWLVEFFAPWCGHCKNLAPHWAEAAGKLKGVMKLGALDATVHTVKASEYGIQGFPTIKFFHNGEVTEYDGGRTASDIIAWATDKAAANIPAPEVKELTSPTGFDEACKEHPICVIAVLPHILDCQSKCRQGYIDMLTKLGDKYKQKQWGWIWSEAMAQPRMEEALDIGGFGYPALAALNAKKMQFALLRGSFSSDGVNEFLRDISYGRGRTAPVKGGELPKISKSEPWDGKDGALPMDDDIDLSDVELDDIETSKTEHSNFDKLVKKSDEMWLVEFFAPWCGHCKNLAPHWAEAAGKLKGVMKLGALDATVHTVKASEYGIQGFPTIKFFHNGEVTEYDGGRTASDIIAWATDKAAANIPAPEVKELTSPTGFDEACKEHPICVIAVLPHILDCQSKCRQGYIDMLTRLGDKYKQKQWGWIWSEAMAQPRMEEALDIGGFGYPALAALNAKKMQFALLRGSFSSDGVNEFLRDISYGRGRTAPVKGGELPKISKSEPWDGKDGALPMDDDIDLSDVELDDIETSKTEL
ncbi:protein disulfide-isomerase A6 homolog [Hyalella azteca]|uniref:protein disulfide-isomerase n=1 Tax=Hyalella azteca TaxID=294128 RepID=A0A979FP56_HYAAZ|nr:protein disulfide-isomerase A6 homolog [Hyalella azteca]